MNTPPKDLTPEHWARRCESCGKYKCGNPESKPELRFGCPFCHGSCTEQRTKEETWLSEFQNTFGNYGLYEDYGLGGYQDVMKKVESFIREVAEREYRRAILDSRNAVESVMEEPEYKDSHFDGLTMANKAILRLLNKE
jgi:hypothetical protein